jgi:UDP-glucose 4-epimerase
MNAGAKRCVVLGANGFIGSALTRLLLQSGHWVLACDLAREFFDLPAHPRLEMRHLDFLDEVAIAGAVEGADWVFHLVSTTKPASAEANLTFDVQTNVIGSIRLFEACAAAGVERVMFASSGGTVYGRPERLPVAERSRAEPRCAYGLAKLTIERYGKLIEERSAHALKVLALRIGNPFGPRHHDPDQGVIPVFMRRIRQGLPLQVWGDGSVVRDYVHVDDVARAFIAAAAYSGQERVFNVASGCGKSLRDIIEQLQALAPVPVAVEYRPGRPFDVPAMVLDISLAERELGWCPQVSFDSGLVQTWESMS